MPDSIANEEQTVNPAPGMTPEELWKYHITIGEFAREKDQMPQAFMHFGSAMKIAYAEHNWDWVVATYCQQMLIPYLEYTKTFGENQAFLEQMLRIINSAENTILDHTHKVSAHSKAVLFMRYAQYYRAVGDITSAMVFSGRSMQAIGDEEANPELSAPHALIKILSNDTGPKWLETLHSMLKKAEKQHYENEAHKLIVVSGCLLRLAEAYAHLGKLKKAVEYAQDASVMADKLKQDYNYPHRSDHVSMLRAAIL
jgi:tetratricopeptide (TPR) repeat protein